MALAGKVGTAPGTTTINVAPGGEASLVGTGQDPGVRIRMPDGGFGYFDARPTDFELAKVYGYQPVARGWISAKLDGALDDFWATLKALSIPAFGAAVGAFALHGTGKLGTAAGAAGGAVLAKMLGDEFGKK